MTHGHSKSGFFTCCQGGCAYIICGRGRLAKRLFLLYFEGLSGRRAGETRGKRQGTRRREGPGNKAAGEAFKIQKKQFLGNCEPLRTTNFQATASLRTCKKPRLLNGRVSHGLNMDYYISDHLVLSGGVYIYIYIFSTLHIYIYIYARLPPKKHL